MMAFSSPIIANPSNEDEDVQFISASTRVQREARAKAGVILQQPLSHVEVAEDQGAAVAQPEKPRSKSTDSLTQTNDHDLDMKRSSSVPLITSRGTTKQFSKFSDIANHIIGLDQSKINDHQPRLGPSNQPSVGIFPALERTSNTNMASAPQPQFDEQSPQPSTVNNLPQKRKSGGKDDSARKCSKVATSANTFSNAATEKVIVYDLTASSHSSTASESSDDFRSDPNYHPSDEESTKSIPKWIQMQRAGLPLKPHIFADLANQLQYSFDFGTFAEKYKMPVSDILDIFSAVVLTPCLDFNENGRKTMPELWKKIKENLPAMERAIETIDGPQKKKLTTGLLGKAVRNAHEMGHRSDAPSKKN